MWYCAHVLHYFEYEDGKQDDYLVWEYMYLIQARSPAEAMAKGELLAKKVENHSEGSGLKLNDRSARNRFLTVRKVVECQDLDEQTEMPIDGTEVSYSEYIVQNKDDFEKLIHGETATLDYIGGEEEKEEERK